MDRNVFLKYLREAMKGRDFHLHAFVLMGNHVHLLATSHTTGTVPRVMHHLGLQYARYFNQHFERRGPLFQGRYWASLIDSQQYFFQAMRYIELNPVRARMVDSPEHFPWSSYAHNAGKESRPEITLHDEFLGLGGGTSAAVPRPGSTSSPRASATPSSSCSERGSARTAPTAATTSRSAF